MNNDRPTRALTILSSPDPLSDASNRKIAVLVERYSFTRGCLCSWIETFCKEIQLKSCEDVSAIGSPTSLAQFAVAIFSAVGLSHNDYWLDKQVSWLRSHEPKLPIIAIIGGFEQSQGTEHIMQLGLQGYIPTTSSPEVAAAVLHLVAAGGTYIPHLAELPTSTITAGEKSAAIAAAGLTPRERKVLKLLQLGMSNKMLAYRLGLSESTVKVHVHRILAKFKVHNRTEAVVAAYRLYGAFEQGNAERSLAGEPSGGADLQARSERVMARAC